MDVEGEERDKFRSSEAQNIRRRIMTKASMKESQMDDEGKERDESRSSTERNTRQRITTKTPLEESKSDERAVAVTTQESSDGIHEKAMRIATTSWRQAAAQQYGPVQGEQRIDRTLKDNELVRSLVLA